MNQKPMSDPQPYSIPIYHLNLDMGTLFIGISKAQYRDIIALVDSMDRMEKGVPYRTIYFLFSKIVLRNILLIYRQIPA